MEVHPDLESAMIRQGAVVKRARPVEDQGPLFRGKGWTEPVTLMLPWPPTLNHYRVPIVLGKTARLVTSTAGKQYCTAVAVAVKNQTLPAMKFVEPVEVEIVCHPPNRARRDLDNHLKAALDGMAKAGVYQDDSLIHRLVLSWGKVIAGGALMVCVRPLEGEKP